MTNLSELPGRNVPRLVALTLSSAQTASGPSFRRPVFKTTLAGSMVRVGGACALACTLGAERVSPGEIRLIQYAVDRWEPTILPVCRASGSRLSKK